MPLPDGQETWATEAETLTLTGLPVEEADLVKAQAVLDLHVGRTIHSAAAVGDADLHYLKLATAYQSVWMKSQLDMFSRIDFTEVTQDSTSAGINKDGLTLAPLAARALQRLSWKRSRSLRVNGVDGPTVDFTNEASDRYHGWLPGRRI